MADTIVVPTTNVDGNITSCKIETQPIKVERNGAFSLRETTTYISYDVCSKKQIEQYSVEGFTIFSLILGVAIIIFGFITLMFIAETSY